ncbi:hypothetical protein Tco_0886576, partial [Tanacetum coccineum]
KLKHGPYMQVAYNDFVATSSLSAAREKGLSEHHEIEANIFEEQATLE